MENIQHLDKTISLYKNDNKTKISHLLDLATTTLNIDSDKSLTYAKKSLALAKKIEDILNEAKSLVAVADAYTQKKLYEQALKYYQQAIGIYQTWDDQEELTKIHLKLGNVFHYMYNYPKALAHFLDSLKANTFVNNEIVRANTFNNIGFVYEDLCKYQEALEYHHKALELRKILGDQKAISGSYNNIGLIYDDLNNPSKALDYYEKALKIKEEIGDKLGIANVLNNIGLINNNLSNYNLALDNHRKSLKIKKDIGDKSGIASSCNNIGFTYQNLGEYDKAISHYLKAIKIKEEIGKIKSTFSTLNNIGISYQSLGSVEKARKYYQKSLIIAQEIGNRKAIANSLNNIGTIYMDQNDNNKALEYFFEALKIKEEVKDTKGAALSIHNIGYSYKNLEEYEKALEYSLKAFCLRKELNDKSGMVTSARSIGEIYTSMKRFDDAVIYLTESLEIAKKIMAKGLIKDSYFCLSEHYAASSDFQKAYNCYKLYAEVKDSIFNEEKNIRIEAMQTRYDIEKRERETEIYHLKNVELTAVVSELNKKNELIIQQKDQLAKTLKGLEITRKRLEIANSILRHDITNDLAVINSAVNIYRRTNNTSILEEIKLRVAKSAETIDRQRKQEVYFADHDKLQDYHIEDVVSEIIKKNEHVNIVTTGKAIAYADDAIYSVFENLLVNSISHGKASQISIQISSSKDLCKISFIDNGCGISQDIKPHIFEKGFFHGESGHTGIGLYIVKQTICQYGGKISIEDNNPHGAIFIIQLKRAFLGKSVL